MNRLLVLGFDNGMINVYRMQEAIDLLRLDFSKTDFQHHHRSGLPVKSLHIGRFNPEMECIQVAVNYGGKEIAILSMTIER